ncbi:MAG: hypothetical protein JWN66_512 [Sphingomonas bacterium]|nr:hypothetical protein [Sphingomonas bacterium]
MCAAFEVRSKIAFGAWGIYVTPLGKINFAIARQFPSITSHQMA